MTKDERQRIYRILEDEGEDTLIDTLENGTLTTMDVEQSLKSIEELEARNTALVRERFRRTKIIGEMERAFE